jgi:hypothetical protein
VDVPSSAEQAIINTINVIDEIVFIRILILYLFEYYHTNTCQRRMRRLMRELKIFRG